MTTTQHNTTNVDYILKGFEKYMVDVEEVIDPFCGSGDLLDWATLHGCKEVLGADIDCSLNPGICDDTLLSPLDYEFVLTNPPYGARNKNPDKTVYDKYNVDDLYKAAIHTFMNSSRGILIIPINFISGKEHKTRSLFLDKFYIHQATIFEEQVFDDTTQAVIAFYYCMEPLETFPMLIQPSGVVLETSLKKTHDYIFGSDFFDYLKPTGGIGRLMEGGTSNSNIYIDCLDTSKPIRASYKEPYYGKISDRSKLTVLLKEELTKEEQFALIDCFNTKLKEFREEYNSLFLSSFREFARKRMTFTQVYQLLQGCIQQ